jgi:hypothetical protein
MSSGVFRITVQLRAPKNKDPGKIAEGWYCVNADNFVVLCDEAGKPLGVEKHQLGPDGDARSIANRMLRRHTNASKPSGFNDRLIYPKLRY